LTNNPSTTEQNTRTMGNIVLPGQYFDAETNLHYNYFRDYDPSMGRYVESDPISVFAGTNTYTYVINNPLKYRDLRGLANEVALDFPWPDSRARLLKIGGICAVKVSIYLTLITYTAAGDACADDPEGKRKECRGDDCDEHFTKCLDTSLNDAVGGNFGFNRCSLCRDTCVQNGGRWSSIAHTGDRCDYWNFK